jgi:hypothetical protein
MNQHPLREFWAKSGWQSDGNNPEDAMSEGKLVIEAWNEAIRTALSEMLDCETLHGAITYVASMKYDVKS